MSNVVTYEAAHEAFIRHHLAKRKGERRGRLQRGHNHAERLFLSNVWWPLFKNFDHLHPEYEVIDWRNNRYFADFAWIQGPIKLIIEIKGFGPHVQEMDRQKYSLELNRETFLLAMGYHVISFSYDDVAYHSDVCKTLLRMVMSRFNPEDAPVSPAVFAEKEVIRLAIQLAGAVRPIDVTEHFGISPKTSIQMLHKLCEKGWFAPVYGPNNQRIIKYELNMNLVDYSAL